MGNWIKLENKQIRHFAEMRNTEASRKLATTDHRRLDSRSYKKTGDHRSPPSRQAQLQENNKKTTHQPKKAGPTLNKHLFLSIQTKQTCIFNSLTQPTGNSRELCRGPSEELLL